ncbi:4-coumarate--CoA ligase [Roseibacterium sp. SDUM158017]|uniref:4-coumarate--CoA ligase n=1 Tax=Roseicyclus salinarum TaxID=3036773 RepID=UPI0024152143|nr:4-coumarate--CoA ligase [Roseibacterium sp. SDUM158017]MDG4648427.1 4-coumarate--CoA ligase [Roseibacterium sp. SDUM158017]
MNVSAAHLLPAADPTASMLGAPQVRRVIVSLTAAFQEEQLRQGRMPRRAFIGSLAAGRPPEALDTLTIDEAGLGLDSLAVIDLVTRLNIFFDLQETGIEDFLLVQRSLGEWVSLLVWHLSRVGDGARITFETSGSTGAPKRVSHAAASLESEVDALLAGALRGMSTGARVLSAVPVHHIYGFLWSILLPFRAGWPALDLPPGAPGAAIRNARPGDVVLGTPFTWDRIAALDRTFLPGVTGVSSGGPATASTWKACRETGLTRMVEVYGSSETGGIGWRDDGTAPFRLMGDICRQAGDLVRPAAGPLAMQDRLVWHGPAEFAVAGRLDAIVQVAGTNVDLRALRDLIEAQPGVREAAVRLDGERLKAFVATAPRGRADLENRLRQAMLALPAPARPDRFSFGSEVPRTASGKLSDW